MINWQLRSYVESYDHASLSVVCSYDHCSGAVTIILPENETTISLTLHNNRLFCLVTVDDKSHIYIVCKLCVPPWHASITIRPGPNSPSPTSAILYERNCYDRNCFPTVIVSIIVIQSASELITCNMSHAIVYDAIWFAIFLLCTYRWIYSLIKRMYICYIKKMIHTNRHNIVIMILLISASTKYMQVK